MPIVGWNDYFRRIKKNYAGMDEDTLKSATAYLHLMGDVSIEGFHDAVRTPYALRPGRHVGFFWNNEICFNFVSILFEKIKLTVSERTYIIVPMV